MWHHIMVTWEQESGRTKMYFDGRTQSAFWVCDDGDGSYLVQWLEKPALRTV
jgi:hypothetical protein